MIAFFKYWQREYERADELGRAAIYAMLFLTGGLVLVFTLTVIILMTSFA